MWVGPLQSADSFSKEGGGLASESRCRGGEPQGGAPLQKWKPDTEERIMTASLTLNKITAQRGISIGEAANRVSDLGWTPSYVQEAMTFTTDYKIYRDPRDPMTQVLRS